jgi:hypothetical protein
MWLDRHACWQRDSLYNDVIVSCSAPSPLAFSICHPFVHGLPLVLSSTPRQTPGTLADPWDGGHYPCLEAKRIKSLSRPCLLIFVAYKPFRDANWVGFWFLLKRDFGMAKL